MKQLQHTLIAALVILMTAAQVMAQNAGIIDSSFDTDGVLILQPGTGLDNVNDMLVLPDDKILVMGITEKPDFDWASAVFRLTPDGQIDSTFGVNGWAIFDADPAHLDFAYGMTLQPDGKIIVVGGVEVGGDDINYFAARLSADGVLDSTFGVNGVSIIHKDGGEDVAYAAVVQNDGKIVLAGQDYHDGYILHDAILLRLLPNGALDTTYGTDGFAVTSFAVNYTTYEDIMLMDDGGVMAVGYTGNYSYDLLAARYDINGMPESTFGSGGFSIIDPSGGTDAAYAIIKHPTDGRILIGGQTGLPNGKTDFLVLSMTSTGLLDSTFGINGLAIFSAKASETILDMSVQVNGKIVAAGTTGGTGIGVNDWAVLRFNEEGTIDTTFGENNGITITEVGSFFSTANAIGLQADGKIIAGGVSASLNNDMCVVRYFGDNVPTGIYADADIINQSLFIYPNPANSRTMIDLNTGDPQSGLAHIELVNVYGQVVYSQTGMVKDGIMNQPLYLPGQLASGNYLIVVRVHDKNYTSQMMIQQ